MKHEFMADNGDRVFIDLPDEPERRVASPASKAKSRAIGDYRREFFKAHRQAASGSEILRFKRDYGKQ